MNPDGPLCLCGVREGHVSPGCPEHARNAAERAHLNARASGLACPTDCPVCLRLEVEARARRRPSYEVATVRGWRRIR